MPWSNGFPVALIVRIVSRSPWLEDGVGVRVAGGVGGGEPGRVGHGPDEPAVGRAADQERTQGRVAVDPLADDPVG